MVTYKEIVAELKSVCRGISSGGVYTQDRPKALAESIKDFIVVNLPRQIDSYGAYALTDAWFILHAKDIGSVENYTRLTEMQEALLARLPHKSEKSLIAFPSVHIIGSDNAGFHALMICCKMTLYQGSETHYSNKY